jgi:hypothetical protein
MTSISRVRKRIKIICSHIEWTTASMFIGLASLAVSLLANTWPWWALALAVLGVLIVAAVAALTSHRQKSIDRIIQFNRDFQALKRERQKAATFLLGRGGKQWDVDEVLDFFDTPIGTLTAQGYLDEELVYDYFFEWIRGY